MDTDRHDGWVRAVDALGVVFLALALALIVGRLAAELLGWLP